MPKHAHLRRRSLLAALALPALAGCTAPLPALTGRGITPEARVLLDRSAAAHGLPAFRAINDVSLRYEGEWAPIVGRLQPVLVDAGFRAGSEERLLPRTGLVAQAHTGPSGRKRVVRRAGPGPKGSVEVSFNDASSQDEDQRAAAALVADGYLLFLLGPILLAGGWPVARTLAGEVSGSEVIAVHGQGWTCDVLRIEASPGLGLSSSDRLALFIDREEGLMRRVRFSLDGLRSTRGAVAEVDVAGHVTREGVRWPTRFHERLLRPLPLPVHDWRLTGFDLNRGFGTAEIDGAAFSGRALPPATLLAEA
ncbi:hypothetical protein [Plastoroseomonas arctica]|uniref:Lipoprotein n=1 Tax=Plastoroseomonas arctica TaxID=1509237 RepID=A0AAF1K6K2_9PROT|nr:hypothetical protein [Plastoroseomonas arctica]MBR0657549.1 hypothetical protein [Plastoroseomonas arctica]